MNEITKRLPVELVRYIKEYIPKKEFVFTNRENYNLYHILIKPCIKDYESYIRYMIRQDNEFVFKKIIEENYRKWYEIRQYKYKNMIFNNYLYFVINFCIENDSNNCRKVISDFLKEHGLGKNLHKKNVVKYIKWKN
jgi:phosphoribosyl-ATP pyrophosphohydrolase